MSPPAARTTLIVCFRRPVPGRGKQRLAARLGRDRTRKAACLLLDCALEDAADWPGAVVLAPDRAEDHAWAASLLPGAEVHAQSGGNLGERLADLDARLRSRGHRRLLFIGSDAPLLEAEQLRAAAATLDQADAVLLPASDGGVVALGSRVPWPQLHDLPWSTNLLAAALLRRCERAGLTIASPSQGRDVDTFEDLSALAPALAGDRRLARRRLEQWLLAQPDLAPPLSVVVPVYRDATQLAGLLPLLRASAGGERLEILVVEAGTPQCSDLCRRHDARHLVAPTPCRGQQQNTGAAAAHGSVFWFLHADARPAPTSAAAVLGAIRRGADGGCFRLRIDARGLAPRLIEAGTALRCSLGGMAYGDQGLFVDREAFLAAGGFAPAPLFEEVALVRALRRRGRFALLDQPLTVSPRRWQRDGWWRRTARNRLLALAYLAGASPERLARRYRPEPGTGQGADRGTEPDRR